MTPIFIDAPQRSDQWFAARLGVVTGSRMADVLSRIKSGESAARRDYRTQLVLERLCGRSMESDYLNADMQRGIDLEPLAIARYESLTGQIVTRSGFLRHPQLMTGASVDGHVGAEGLVEVKCPRPATHLTAVRGQTIPAEYLPQCQHALWISGCRWIDWVSYGPDFPPSLDLVVVRLARNARAMAAHEQAVTAFLDEIDTELAEIRALMPHDTTEITPDGV